MLRLLILLCLTQLAEATKRVSIIGDALGRSTNVFPEMLAAAVVNSYDAQVILRFESSTVVNEQLIGGSTLVGTGLVKAPSADSLLFVSDRGNNLTERTIFLADIQPGMKNQTTISRFFTNSLSSKKIEFENGNLTRSAQSLASQVAKRSKLSQHKPISDDKRKKENERPFTVAVMAPKISLIARKATHDAWVDEAKLVQDLIEASLSNHFSQATLVDRTQINRILVEKKIALIGQSAENSISAMRLLGADYLIRPVVNIVGKDGETPFFNTQNLGLEITFLVIRSSDGRVCSSVLHDGPYTHDAVRKMIPQLSFPIEKKKSSEPSRNDHDLLAWENDFLRGFITAKKFNQNEFLQRYLSLQCCRAIYATSKRSGDELVELLNLCSECYPNEYISWRRELFTDRAKRNEEHAKRHHAAVALEKQFKEDADAFFKQIANCLDEQSEPRYLRNKAYVSYASNRPEECLEIFRKYQKRVGNQIDLRKTDSWYYRIGARALAQANKPRECAEWLESRSIVDRSELLLSDCYAEIGDDQKEFEVLKKYRKEIKAGDPHHNRLIDLAVEREATKFLYSYLLYEMQDWDYNTPHTQYNLYRCAIAEGDRDLAARIVANERSANPALADATMANKWLTAAKELGVANYKGEDRKFPFELNPIGEHRVIEIIPFGDYFLQTSLEEMAQGLATIMGCSVKLYGDITPIERGGIYDFSGRFFYGKRIVSAFQQAAPIKGNVIERIIVSMPEIRDLNETTDKPGVVIWGTSYDYGSIIYPRYIFSSNPFERDLGPRLVTATAGLSALHSYGETHFKRSSGVWKFTRNSPDPCGSSGVYTVSASQRASYGPINAPFYQQIDWDKYLDHVHRSGDQALEAGYEHYKILKPVSDELAGLLNQANQSARVFKPKKLTKRLKLLRSYDHNERYHLEINIPQE